MKFEKLRSHKLLLSALAIVVFLMFLPVIPIKATVVEGEIENIPQPIGRIVQYVKFKLRFTLENTTFTFNIEGNPVQFQSGTVYVRADFTETKPINGSLRIRLYMYNCVITTPDFQANIGQITLQLFLDVTGEHCYVVAEATSHLSIAGLISQLFNSRPS